MIQRILIVSSEFPPLPGGIGNHAYNLAIHLYRLGYEPLVLTDQRSHDANLESEYDAVLPFRVERIKLQKCRCLMYVQRIRKTFRGFQTVDYVIATGKFSLWNVALIGKFLSRPRMAIIHGTEVNFKSKILKHSIELSLKSFDRIIAVSHYTKGLVSHLRLPVEVIPNGIDLKQWQRDDITPFPLKGTPVIITVGRVSTRKGQLQVIKQLPVLLTAFPNLHYHCIGIPTEADDFMEIAQELHVENHVTFHGQVDATTLKQLLQGSDIFIMISQESPSGDVEGFGIAILEANALGIPTIGTFGCGIEDAIWDGYSGILVRKEDPESVKHAIFSILKTYKEFSKNAMIWAKQHSWEHIVKQYDKAIRRH